MKTITLLLLMLAAATHLYSQNSCDLELRGKVTDEHNGEALGFADVILKNQDQATVTNAEGVFSLRGICPGEVRLEFRHVGCEPTYIQLELAADTTISVFMEHHVELLDVIEVERLNPHQDIGSRAEVNLDRIERIAPQSFADFFEREQGVQAIQSGSNISKPMIHGLSGTRIALIDQGVALEGQQWGTEHAPELDPFSIEEAEVVFGASGLRYGPEAMAGAIVTRTKKDTIRPVHGRAHVSGATNGRQGAASLSLKGAVLPNLPLFASAQGTLLKAADLQAPDYSLDNTASEEGHFRLGLYWIGERFGAQVFYRQFNTNRGILSYAHIGNLTDLNLVLENEQPITPSDSFSYRIRRPFQHVEHEVTNASFWWQPRLETKLTATVSRQFNLRQEFDNSIYSVGDEANLQFELSTLDGQLEIEHRWSPSLKTELGLVGQRQANTYTGRFFIPNFLAYEWGGFVIQHIQLDKGEWEAGIRYDGRWQQAFFFENEVLQEPIRNFEGLSWNVGYQRNFNWMDWSINLAQGWRPPAINELYSDGLHHGAAAIETGNPDLEEETVWSLNTQLEFLPMEALKGRWTGMARAHVSYYDQFIYLIPTGTSSLTIRGAFPGFGHTPVDAWFRGVDLNLKGRYFEHVAVAFGAEIIRANQASNGAYLLYIPPDQADVTLSFFGGKQKRWNLSAAYVFVNKQFRVPPNEDYASPPDRYGLFEFAASLEITREKSAPMVIEVSANNALNTRYRSYLNRLRYFADQPGTNVNLSLRIPFGPSS